MIQTNNYGFNIVEGTDVVNPLVQLNPNFSNLDIILKTIADTGVGTALQVKSGTNHAITKDDDCSVFKFIATADYRTGDTFTLNGDTVTLRCMDGTIPKDRAFVINQSVMCAINGTLLTLIGGGGSDSASDVIYDNQTSGLSATDVQEAIDELKSDIDDVPIIDNASDIHYDNTFSGLTATDVQSAIDEIGAVVDQNKSDIAELKKNNYGTIIDITPYNTPGNVYTAPSDGYLNMDCRAASNVVSVAVLTADGRTVAIPRLSGIQYLSNCIFIKKGMKMYVNTNVGTNIINFTTLV